MQTLPFVIIQYSLLLQVHSLFQNEFCTEGNPSFLYLVAFLRSPNSCLHLRPRHIVTSILSSTLSSLTLMIEMAHDRVRRRVTRGFPLLRCGTQIEKPKHIIFLSNIFPSTETSYNYLHESCYVE